MSARFFKIFSGVLLAHLVILSVVWIGFSAPNPRLPAVFTYEGALPAGDGRPAEEVWPKGKTPDKLDFDHFEASYFPHWIELRGPSK